MGDLILLCVAIEELGLNPREFAWVIERRSAPWARHLGITFVCYDETPLRTQWRLAGRFATVVNTEQRYGLSQFTALLARRDGGRVVCFDSNLAARWADVRVPYDPLVAHEVLEFGRLVATATGCPAPSRVPVRSRRVPPAGKPVVGLGGLQGDSRRLTAHRWLEVIRGWSNGREVCISAAPDDREFARHVCDRLGGQARMVTGDFDAVCDVVRSAEEVLTIDSGFLHVASYYGVPVACIFTSSREQKWASLSPGSRLIRRSDLACQPCALYAVVPACPYGFACRDVEFPRDLR
jgi:hypothetical protein